MAKYVKKKNRLSSVLKAMIYVLVIVIAITSTYAFTTANQRVKYEKQIEEVNAIHEAEMEALRSELCEDYTSQMAELERYYEYGGDVDLIELEAEYIAKVIYGTARNHSDNDKKAVVWCILNRVEHYAHPNNVAEVCEQPKQWMGYSSNNPVLTDNYDLALAELKIWHGEGHRPISNEYIYLSWSSSEIMLRDTFEETRDTHYWRMR